MSAVAKAAHVWERDELDWYVEPERVTRGLLAVERFVGSVLDPACGQGNIVRTLLAGGVPARGSDIRPRVPYDESPWQAPAHDFIAGAPAFAAPNIVTNPPFFRAAGAEAFIRRSLAIATGKVVIFCDIRFLAGVNRAEGLFAEHPPHRIWIIVPRVFCPPGAYLAAGGKAKDGSSDWCWLVWDRTAFKPAFAETRWLNLDEVAP